ncbi:MAG TPA: leucyl/phenylalanyl-tRNA--protein transferase [Spongiibacteraceae bacterium]|nr:leucyl/phenylalanyl-tRNA--protein transferase [Spongiibacteraceae bacterium]
MEPIPWLTDRGLWFPPVEQALDDPNGLLAVGGDLSPERLISAYHRGIFPWYEDPQPVLWWSPDPRCILFPDQVHIPRRLARKLRSDTFELSFDRAFPEVIAACGTLSSRRPGTWITADMRNAYTVLHELGQAHSVEVWQDRQLVGGLYGVAIGRVFFGESMFSRTADASKIALISLGAQLQRWGFAFIDCQVSNPHMARMGALEVSRADFLDLLRPAIGQSSAAPPDWRPVTPPRGYAE